MEERVPKKLLFIYNPYSGKGTITRKLADIIDIFVKGNYEVTVYPTQKPLEAIELTRERSSGYDLLVCSGGDGTLDEVVTGMMQAKFRIPIGYIPAGSTNDFAKSMHLPRSMTKAAEVIVQGEKYACDIGAFEEDTFVYIAAFGLFADVSYETSQEVKNVLGQAAYLLEGMKRLSSIESYRLKVETHETKCEDEFIFGMITNSHSVGGFKKVTGKNVRLNDGLFEVIFVKNPRNPLELNAILAAILRREVDTKYMFYVKTDYLMVQSEEGVAWTLDGEYGGTYEEITIRNCQQALEIIVPNGTKI
ncbi:MAG: YegS/Rv2252/BmrU family lipid kinase [Eubacteriales bacterium]